jgi:hypothetical protein
MKKWLFINLLEGFMEMHTELKAGIIHLEKELSNLNGMK